MSRTVRLGFEETCLLLPLDAIMPLREIPRSVLRSVKYRQIEASIAEV
ncbi:MAG: ParB-like nuclease protein, partial [Rhizorhabdus sp.]|nr:ParB-like nuclease protein [Rhizorhabdus sp.]